MQWVEVTHKLESAPLDDSVNKQGEAAFKRLSDVHDVHVLLCPALLSEFNGMKYAYAHTITRQYMLASGAFQIENPDKMADAKATALAGVESVLKTYQAILQQKPDAKAKALDDLLKKQSQGKLRDCEPADGHLDSAGWGIVAADRPGGERRSPGDCVPGRPPRALCP
jgi:hypothetical protein